VVRTLQKLPEGSKPWKNGRSSYRPEGADQGIGTDRSYTELWLGGVRKLVLRM
jgi:hypothetical protein